MAASSSWSRSRDPRIVYGRGFGGKDRHSKVVTVRGLRDRRIRLSVPTAIQLYHLQHLLGLNQPSMAVDWLINISKHDIDELPPLQLVPTSRNFSVPSTSKEIISLGSNSLNDVMHTSSFCSNLWSCQTEDLGNYYNFNFVPNCCTRRSGSDDKVLLGNSPSAGSTTTQRCLPFDLINAAGNCAFDLKH